MIINIILILIICVCLNHNYSRNIHNKYMYVVRCIHMSTSIDVMKTNLKRLGINECRNDLRVTYMIYKNELYITSQLYNIKMNKIFCFRKKQLLASFTELTDSVMSYVESVNRLSQ